MKRNLFIALMTILVLGACARDEFYSPYALAHISEDLHISQPSGIALEDYIVEEVVAINIKLVQDQSVRVKIKDIEGTTISQEQIKVYEGNNVLKVYVKALPKSSYTIEVLDLGGGVIGSQILAKN